MFRHLCNSLQSNTASSSYRILQKGTGHDWLKEHFFRANYASVWIVFLQKDKPLNACDTAEADCIRLRIKSGLFWICRSLRKQHRFFFLFFFQWIQYDSVWPRVWIREWNSVSGSVRGRKQRRTRASTSWGHLAPHLVRFTYLVAIVTE